MDESLQGTIADELIAQDLLTRETLKKAEQEAHAERIPLTDILIMRNYAPFAAIAAIMEKRFAITAVDVLHAPIEDQALALFSENVIRKYTVLPYMKKDDGIQVIMADPVDIMTLDDLQMLSGQRIEPLYAPKYQIADRIELLFTSDEEEKDSSEALSAIITEAEDNLEIVSGEQGGVEDLLKSINETPVIRITNKILLEAIKRGASDVFVEPWEKTMRIRCRVDGILEEFKSPPKSMANSIVSRIKVMSELDIAERRLPQDGRFKIKYQKREVDFRVSILPTCFGEKVCLRVLDKTAQAQNIDKLGFHPDELERIKKCAERPHGMLLVTGPTGSGKTSTLYSVLNYLDAPGKNITTVEDPVEYMMYGINQVNVRESVGLTFAGALRSILRQDPDIIMIGEIRDFETMDIAIKAALTGHLVLSTLHTNDACSAITRMVNMDIEPFLISSSVLMISAQRLVRRLCPDCKRPYDGANDVIEQYRLRELVPEPTVYKPSGCATCRDTGYKGRMVITEVLLISDAVKALVMEGVPIAVVKAKAREEGMSTLRESGMRKVAEGQTSIEEILRVTAEDATE